MAALALGGCGGIDASGLGGGLGDYVWGDSSKSSGTASAAGLSSGDAIAPDMANVDDAEPIAKHYNAGLNHMKKRNYRSAAESFTEVERQHPYSIWATRAVLMQAYAQYMRNSYDDAINAAKRFITLHPGHKDAAYAYYLIALSYYEQISDVKRDQSSTKQALLALDEVSRRFPDTPYARDAAAKAVLARDHLAGKEMEIGRYYQDRDAHLAAINRFKTVITEYQTTTHVPEALYRLTETYLALGVQGEAQTAAAVLGHNYPSSQWYKDAFALLQGEGLEPYETEGSWISKAINKVNPFSG
jgi:outer membrane protein assembly factor BamD